MSVCENRGCGKENDLRKEAQSLKKEDPSFSLRSPLTRNTKSWAEQSDEDEARRERRQRIPNYRSKNSEERKKPTLGQFAPNLVNRTKGSPRDQEGKQHKENTERNRRIRSEPKQRPRSHRKPESSEKAPAGHSCDKKSNTTQSVSCGPKTRLRPLSKSSDCSETADESKDSRVRKCLWVGAEEVDEAFCEGETSFDDAQSDELEASPRPPLTEQQLARRQKDIDYGKSTSGYSSYLTQIKREARNKKCPVTPDKQADHSRRKWDSLVHKWRRDLHNYDDPREDISQDSKENTPSKGQSVSSTASSTPSRGRSSSSASLSSIPSDAGYATTATPDQVKAALNFNLPDAPALLPSTEFPPLGNGVAATAAAPVWVKPDGKRTVTLEVKSEDVEEMKSEAQEEVKSEVMEEVTPDITAKVTDFPKSDVIEEVTPEVTAKVTEVTKSEVMEAVTPGVNVTAVTTAGGEQAMECEDLGDLRFSEKLSITPKAKESSSENLK